jgi:hypothetical protein
MLNHVKASMTLDIYVDFFDQEDPEAFSAAGNGLSSIYYGRLPRCGGITASDCGQLPNREPAVPAGQTFQMVHAVVMYFRMTYSYSIHTQSM